MLKMNKTNFTGKAGVSFVRVTVEDSGSLFHKIESENDLGIDGFIEFLNEGNPLNRQIAVQIKSGNSYYRSKKRECHIPIENHREYWLNYPLPVIGIVFVPDLKMAFWVDIKYYLKAFPNDNEINFTTDETNYFHSSSFTKLFMPLVLAKTPDLSLNEAIRLFESSIFDEFYIGLTVLFRRHADRTDVWVRLIKYFVEEPVEKIPDELVVFISYIPGHPDLLYNRESLTKESRQFAQILISNFTRFEVIKLLSFIDENGITRGSIGQCVEAIISSLPNSDMYLKSIIRDKVIDLRFRENASLILAYTIDIRAIPTISLLLHENSKVAALIINDLNSYGYCNPY